jgi:RNA polymerase sigma-70 factor (ECF subfamily)
MEDITKDILMKAADGDMDAFEKIYKAAGDYVYNVAFRIIGNKELAEEVTQDVFLKIYESLKDFEFRSAIKTWIYRITVNTALNASKKRSKDMGRVTDYDEEVLNKPASDILRERINEEENEILVQRLLTALEPDQKACVVLRDMEGLSYKDIAQTLMINVNTVRSRLKRAREKLSRAFRERGDLK